METEKEVKNMFKVQFGIDFDKGLGKRFIVFTAEDVEFFCVGITSKVFMDREFFCLLGSKKVYQWDGKFFVLVGYYDENLIEII